MNINDIKPKEVGDRLRNEEFNAVVDKVKDTAQAIDGISSGFQGDVVPTFNFTNAPKGMFAPLESGPYGANLPSGGVVVDLQNRPLTQLVWNGVELKKKGDVEIVVPPASKEIPSWTGATPAGEQRMYNGQLWRATIDTLNEDVPGVSGKWLPELDKVSREDVYITTSAGVINNTPSSGNSYLILNKEIEANGTVTKLRFRTVEVGICKVVVLKRVTSTNPNPEAGDKDLFELVATYDIEATVSGINELNVDIPVLSGYYLGINGREGVKISYQSSAPSIYGWWQQVDTGSMELTFQPIDFNFGYDLLAPKYATLDQLREAIPTEPKINVIIASRNVEDYNSIRNIIKGITDATEQNRYLVIVPFGDWFEVDLQGKDWVDIQGLGINETRIYCDGNDTTKVLPDDYYYVSERGKVISTVNLSYLHVVFGLGNTNYSNLTLHQTRGKYAAHLDNISFKELTFKNVKFSEDGGSSYPVGIGVRGGQKINFFDCIMHRNQDTIYHSNGKLGMFIHNWNNQSSECEVNVINTRFVNCGYAMIDECGSDHSDKFNFINCSTNDIGQFTFMVDIAGGVTFWTNPATGTKEADPKNVPYNIKVNAVGTRVDLVQDRSASNFTAPYNTGTQRPLWHTTLISDYFGLAIIEEGVAVLKGQVLAYGSTFGSSVNTPVAKPFVGFADAPILGIALADSNNGEVMYVPHGKYAQALVNGAIGSGDLNKKIIWDDVNKYLKADPSADIRQIQGFAQTNKSSGVPYAVVKLI